MAAASHLTRDGGCPVRRWLSTLALAGLCATPALAAHGERPAADSLAIARDWATDAARLVQADSVPAACAIYERAVGVRRRHDWLAGREGAELLFRYGRALMLAGGDARAVPLLEEARRFYDAPASRDSLGALQVTRALGDARRTLFDLAGARDEYERYLRAAVAGPVFDTVAVADAEAAMAMLYRSLNDPVRSREMFERALARLGPAGERAPGLYRTVLHRYVVALRQVGAYDTALVLARRSLALRRATPGISGSDLASSLGTLSNVLADLGRFDEAEPQQQEAYRIIVATRGADHPDAVTRLINLGGLARARGDYTAAESLFTELVAGRRRRYGDHHLGVAEALYDLALIHLWQGRDSLALREGDEAARIRRDDWRTNIPFLSERGAAQLTDEWWRGHEVAIDAALASAAPDTADLGELWHTAMELRTVLLDELALRRIELAQMASQRSSDWDAYERTRRALARVATSGTDLVRDPSARGRRDSLAAAAESLEVALRASQRAVRVANDVRHTSWAQVRAALPAEGALVGVFRYGRVLKATPLDRWRMDLRFQYAAFVMSGRDRVPRVVALGDAGELDSLMDRWVTQATTGADDAAGVAALRRTGRELRRRVWDPIVAAAGAVARLYLVPDGEMHRVAWEALPAAGGRWQVEEPLEIVRLFSERDLVDSRLPAQHESGPLLAVGMVDFDSLAAPPMLASNLRSADHAAWSSCASVAERRFASLPATAQELAHIARTWSAARSSPVLTLSGRSATRSAFVEHAPQAGHLHVATHGFALPGSCGGTGDSKERWSEDPLARCGLVFAGANRRVAAGPGLDDGLLTGSEIALLDLHEVESVVLSACHSGEGTRSLTEGVFGLPRAFRIAGVRTVVSSLWAVDDESTRAWMAEFYRQRLVRDASYPAAARAASRHVLALLRASGRATSPRLWSAFVSAGREH